jgi:hypothetical protein
VYVGGVRRRGVKVLVGGDEVIASSGSCTCVACANCRGGRGSGRGCNIGDCCLGFERIRAAPCVSPSSAARRLTAEMLSTDIAAVAVVGEATL